MSDAGMYATEGIAVVGLAGRFPKARDVETFWENLRSGLRGISTFTEEELLAAGHPAETVRHARYVKARGALEDTTLFDAAFFDFTAREAELTDPQHRLLLECAWEALEDAGYDSRRYPGRIGVFAGASMSTYLLDALRNGMAPSEGLLQLAIGNLGDFLSTRLSYKLDLRGPSMNVQTACSTSLVATHLACLHLLAGQCDMALAGGVSARAREVSGYLYQEGGIFSPDGHCRAFDARAQGTVEGSGVGLVVLMRLEDALAEGANIRAVIRATTLNNDGLQKVGYTAPSVQGQAEVITLAHGMAEVDASTISYLEAHGTGTSLGDPMELTALAQVFGEDCAPGACVIGSVKSSIGHLDAAAGVAGLIKTVLALEHKQFPPSLDFEAPNPRAPLDSSPFRVNTRLAQWPDRGVPRRAGLSSFGIGGTNAHAVLEEAAPREPSPPSSAPQLLVLSARTPSAGEAMCTRLARHLERHPEQSLADVAHTLQVGRRAFAHRWALVCQTREEAIAALSGQRPGQVHTGSTGSEEAPVAFLFSGQGSQYVDMGRELHTREPVFREALDQCARLLQPHLGLDLRHILYPPEARREEAAARLDQTALTQPALFAVEYALARLWESWGIRPRALLGHSLGEYVAACLAGVFSLEDALALVATRGRLIQELPPGAMLGIPLSESELRPLLGERLSLAAINGPMQCVAAGPTEDIHRLERTLAERNVACTRLRTSHAFHSAMMEPVLAPFAAWLSRVALKAPRIPFLSNVTGDWITPAEATDPHYWVRHLREPVRFAEGLKRLLGAQGPLLLEVGPGRTLASLASRHPERSGDRPVLSSMRHPREQGSDTAFARRTLGQLWLAGAAVNWKGLHTDSPRPRVPLPTYPFERQRYVLGDSAPPPLAPEPRAPAPPAARHARPGIATAYVEPTHPLERQVANIWQECLGYAPIGSHDDFLELGGHSLLGTQIISRLEDALGARVPLRQLFETPTVAGLAAWLGTRQLRTEESPRPGSTPSGGEHPLSFAQQRMWALEQFTPGSSAYHLPQALRLRGPLDVAALEASFTELVRRHGSLRTTFPSREGQPVQRIAPPAPVYVRQVDFQPLPEAGWEEATRRFLLEEAEAPFELSQGPLMRLALARLAPEEHVLAVTLHHIIADGASLRVLTREMMALYDALRRGQRPALPELPRQYADHARQQREWLQGPVLEERLSWWKERLAGLPVLELPTDRPRPSTPTYRAGHQPLALSGALSEAVRALARSERATPFMVLLAAFGAVLGRYSGQRDLAIGTPIAGRTRTELEGLIGLFVNTLVLRVDLSGDPSGRELLSRVQEMALGAYAHQELPFEKLVEELHPEREPSRSPLFQVMLSLQEEASDSATLGGLSVERLELPAATTQVDLTLWLRPTPQGFAGALEYSTGLFEAAAMARLARTLEGTLEALTAAPERRLSELTRPSGAELEALLAATRRERVELPPVTGIHQFLERTAALHPERPALITAERTLSHRELDRRANHLAWRLRALGAGPEVRVGLCADRSVEAIVALLGVLKTGAAYVPLDPTAPRERLLALLKEVEAPLVLAQAPCVERVSGGGARVLRLEDFNDVLEGEPVRPLDVALSPEGAAYVLHTSGSTGQPKGVVVPHRALLNHLEAVRREYALSPEDRVLQFASLHFDVAAEELFPTLAAGAAVVLRRAGEVEPVDELRALIARSGVTVVNLPSPYWHEWVDELPRLAEALPPSVRLVVTGSQAPSPERLSRWRERVGAHVRWLNAYGPTEATITSTVFEPRAEVERPRVPIGRPLAGIRLYLLDERLRPVPAGAPGELFIGGRGLARGYLGRPAATAESFIPDPFTDEPGARMYRTGDLARLLPDGNVEFLGRRDHQVKLRGYRIELGEVEAALERTAELREVAVLLRENSSEEARLEAYAVPATEGLTEGGLRERLGGMLPRYMVPARIVLLEALPRLPSGKVDRQALASMRAPEDRPGEAFVAPRDATEETLARIWAEVLKLEKVGIHDNFFERGGDSLLAIRVVARANQRGLPITAPQLLRHQTIAQLAAVAAGPSQAPEPEVTGGPVPLTPPQRRFLEQGHAAPHHWNRALLLEVHEPLDTGLLREALQHLLRRHDALRLRFSHDAEGWHQEDSGETHEVPLSQVDLSSIEEAGQQAAITAAATALQESLHLSRGPLWRVAYLNLGARRPGRLLLLFHFLVADGVSWAIFIDELQALYAHLAQGRPLQLPPARPSFKTWAERLEKLARSESLQDEASVWLAQLGGSRGTLPRDSSGENTEASMRTIRVELPEAQTRAFLQRIASRSHRPEAVLLAPLAQVLSRWMGGAALLVDVGRHGRELRGGLEASTTMGCLASDCPVLLDVGRGDVRRALEHVEAALHRIPEEGLGHGLLRYLDVPGEPARRLRAMPDAEVSFDYMSRRMLAETSGFRWAPEPSGPERSPQSRRSHVLQLIASVVDTTLRLEWRYSQALHERTTVERLAADHLEGLRALLTS